MFSGVGDGCLAAEVLQVSGLIAQDGAARDGAQYQFPVMDMANGAGSEHFALSRDDTLQLIGLLNSSEVDIAKRELGGMLGRLDRDAVEGITRRLFSAYRRRHDELEDLENE
ncbi:unnamed protein product, partial [Polarella glacialis]